jgi:hypothetical protein
MPCMTRRFLMFLLMQMRALHATYGHRWSVSFGQEQLVHFFMEQARYGNYAVEIGSFHV